MSYLFKQFDERSGINYHEAEYTFLLDPRVLFSHVNIGEVLEEYHSSCQMSPFKLKFCMRFAKVYAQENFKKKIVVCIIRMKRIDNLPTPITVRFTLTLELPMCLVFHFPETEIACGQEIQKVFNPFLDFSTLCNLVHQPLNITLRFTFFDCHKNKRERDVSQSSDEDLRRSSKHCKI
ncbi:hypothetical protein AVEN_71223-1 [Araneus ventricosus]|uniref:Uncharacterized protein n=1 Tax=Araneus ventricosus TaxID=182803 RepID=A0A4Y2IPP4_ARAVE|nr:hypothetical protein AVEN_71223-1 [Araneus ventricosus]